MAEITIDKENLGNVQVVTWSNITSSDTAQELPRSNYSDKCVQVVLNSGTLTSLVIEGSNDGTNYVTLTDPAGNDLDFAAAGLKQITENPRYIRPGAPSGTSPDVTVVIVSAKVG